MVSTHPAVAMTWTVVQGLQTTIIRFVSHAYNSEKEMKSIYNSLLLALALTAFTLPTQAHEFRYIGNGYAIQVGSVEEPPVHGVLNGIAFFAGKESVPGDVSTIAFLDRTQGDIVDVVAIPFKLTSESYNAPISQIFPILAAFEQTVIEDSVGYSKDFTYPTAGAYGYIVSGALKQHGQSQYKFFVEKFVCGAGSQDTTYGTFFECVE